MSNEKFSELCDNAAAVLTVLSKQSKSLPCEMVFSVAYLGETLEPLAEVILEMAKAAKKVY